MSYKKRLIIFFVTIIVFGLIMIGFFVWNTKNNFQNLNTGDFIPQEAKEIFEAR